LLFELTGLLPATSETANPCANVYTKCESIGGPGYRVYYTMLGKALALLLCGGDKRSQSYDIDRALQYLRDYKERTRTP